MKKKPLYTLIPDRGDFRRRIRSNRVMCEDHFPKQTRNIDYLDTETEFFLQIICTMRMMDIKGSLTIL